MPTAVALPPSKLIRPGADSAALVERELTSVIAGHPQAVTTYTFYEVLDDWVGPWGSRGYPIGYGKFYNVLFSENDHLNNNPAAKQWVWNTTILLQTALRDYVVGRVRDGTIQALTEPELRAAAFDSHPVAYTRGGLATLMLAAPELVPVIATIPRAEFSPTSDSFGPTIKQVFVTIGHVAPEAAGNAAAAGAGPAHNQMFRIAVQRDIRRQLDFLALGRELSTLKLAIQRGAVDHMPTLDAVIASLNARQFPDQGFARLAREVIDAARQRRHHVILYYNSMLKDAPEIAQRARERFPEYFREH